ncbi:FG-GAP repeat protein [Nitrosomonas sp. Nm84]|uniref:FG-GAP repeat protein n=1 Tax=Nitrosomonas sp. Nm84 TaxID=200124 RepID=UPI000D76C1C0|nr:FG-GAP repeat protein [Nitrosomonas sp. Nm84]PXW89874.1 FG-GAP repeat protein [Nitrosomonas sp. Nm84]
MAISIINVSILNGSNGFRLDGQYSGRSVSSAGDINGDGFDDVMVGAFFESWYAGNFGSSYVVFGQDSGFAADINLSNLDGSNGFRLDAPNSNLLPFFVSDAGDINGDGFGDVIIGAKGVHDEYGNPQDHAGASYVVFGRDTGFTADIDLSSLDDSNGFRLDAGGIDFLVSGAGDVNGDGFDDVIVGTAGTSYVVFGKASGFSATMNLSGLDGNNGFRLDGAAEFDLSGSSVSSAGDVNGDGFDDVLVGAYRAEPNGEVSGSSYVVFGKAGGFDAVMNVSSLDGTNGFRLDGVAEGDWSGRSVSNAGDVNGDGFGDVIIGAFGADPDGSYTGYSGSSYVVFGRASGFDATMNLSGLDGTNGFRLDGVEAGDRSGRSVSSAGDVNGDGFDDVLVGAPEAHPNGELHIGASYVVFGKASGFNATMNLSSLDGNDGFRLDGRGESGFFGYAVSSAGDVNSDGFDDLIIGDSIGISYVVFGGKFITGEAVYQGTSGNDNLTGTILAERFEAGDGNDRMSGLGGADIFHGGDGDDTTAVPDLNFQQIDGGIGVDTLALTGSDLKLDLADFHDTIDGIETIDLTGSGDNALMLTLPDLLSLSDTTDTFTVNGNGGDSVVGLSDGWTDDGIDGNYRIFTNSGTTLRIDRAVHTDVPIAGVINLAGLDGSNGFRLDGAEYDGSSSSVSGAGDVNGDGFDDVIVNAGAASGVVFGHASGFSAATDLSSLNGNNGFRLDGAGGGFNVSNAGDVNSDGFDDVIVGDASADSSGDESGSSYVVFGKAAGFDAALDLSSLDGSNGFRLDGATKFDYSGRSVSSAGDVNGDGFDDVIVGADRAEPNGRESGSSYVVFGKASGFDAAMNLSSLDGNNGFRLDGAAAYNQSGSAVSSAGDINGDGFDDVLVGARYADPNGLGSGSSYIVFGRASGFDAAMNLSNLDGSNGFRLDGVTEQDVSGYSVSSAGDVNGDGFADMIIGAKSAGPNGYGSGSSYVVFGKATRFDAQIDLSSLDGSNGFRLDGVASNDSLGSSVSSAGDINGDGFDDVIVGAYAADSNGYTARDSGSSYVVFGKASGFSAAMNLSSLDGTNGIRLDGVARDDYSGKSVSSAGDVNRDGFDDLLVGAPRVDSNGKDSGSSYVIFGRSDFGGGSGGNVIAGTPGNDVLKGTSAADIFEAGDGNDKMIGRSGADVFHGGAGDDYIQVADLGFGSVDGGSGNDTLHLDGKDLNLDLANLGDKIHGIETICLYGRGDNELTLTANGVLNLSDTTNTLRVNGNAGDHITVQDDGWVDGGPRGSGYYHVYTHDDAVLLVGQNVTVDFA